MAHNFTRTICRRAPLLWAAATLLSTSVITRPAVADTGGIYLGADVGDILGTYRRADINNGLSGAFASAGETLDLSSSFVHQRQTPGAVEVGYRFTPYLGLEASYLALGTVEYASRGTVTTVLASGPAVTALSFKSRGPALALTGVLPMTNDWSLTGRLGACEARTVTHYYVAAGTNSSSGSDSKTSTSLLAGVGTQYIVAAHWVVRLDYTHLNGLGEKVLGRSFNVDLLTLGVDYAF